MEKSIKDKFGLVWPIHVNNLTHLLIEARRVFDGDLDMFLILAVIGDRTFSARKADPNQDFDAWQSEGFPLVAPDDVNVRSIAESSGIPRETVRRKLTLLSDKGWIARNRDGVLIATTKARNDLKPLTQAGIHYLSQLFQLFQRLPKA